jgi:hypothetical protein
VKQDDFKYIFITEIKPVFVEYLKTNSIDYNDDDRLKFFEDRILTLPDNILTPIFHSYEQYKSLMPNPNNPYYDYAKEGLYKTLMTRIELLFREDTDNNTLWGDTWKDKAKRIRRLDNLPRLPMSQKLKDSLTKNEKRIRPMHREHMLLFNENGELLDEVVGLFDSCGSSYAYIGLPNGTYVEIHNHPLGHDSFSYDDLAYSLLRHKIPITRVVTLDGTHEVMFTNDLLSDYQEIMRILSYYKDVKNEQSESDEYGFLYEILNGENDLGKNRNRLVEKCRNSNRGFTELYELEKQVGLHDLGRKASIEVISATAEEYGFVYNFYPINTSRIHQT